MQSNALKSSSGFFGPFYQHNPENLTEITPQLVECLGLTECRGTKFHKSKMSDSLRRCKVLQLAELVNTCNFQIPDGCVYEDDIPMLRRLVNEKSLYMRVACSDGSLKQLLVAKEEDTSSETSSGGDTASAPKFADMYKMMKLMTDMTKLMQQQQQLMQPK